MTSSGNKEAFVWIWLPDQTEPIVAGRLEADNGNVLFNYGMSYLERINDQPPAIPIYEPELPLKSGALLLAQGLSISGCIRDASPDAWGRRVIINKKLGRKGAGTDTGELDVAPVKLIQTVNKDILLIERFDRQPQGRDWSRRSMVSALTLFGLDEMMARYASYETLAEIIRHRFTDPKNTLKELFSRLVFNILCGNTDDHARNHAAFWNGKELTLTPAYDICPQGRADNEASQAMLISGNNNLSQLKTCLDTAKNFLISEDDARTTFAYLTHTIEQHWEKVCDEATLSEVDKTLFWRRQFLNPFSLLE